MEKRTRTYLIQALLFIITFFTTTLAGEWWIHGNMWLWTDYSWADFSNGLPYSIPFLLILTVHEFGHYFTARYHKIKTTLPYYIPLPPIPLFIGTMGAVIRIKQHIQSKKIHFDVGIAGPLTGFVIAFGLLVYAFTHLPEPEYIYKIHPEYEEFGLDYKDHVYTYDFQRHLDSLHYTDIRKADSLKFAADGKEGEWYFQDFKAQKEYTDVSVNKPLLFLIFEKLLVDDPTKIPDNRELMHYPLLFAGFLALFFTALNLMPIGQLDGGHVLYGLIGYRWHKRVATVIFLAFLFYAGLGYITPYDNTLYETGFLGLPSFIISIPLYIGFLYITLKGLRKPSKDTLMYAVIIFAIQFAVTFLFPHVQGYAGWLLFALILGRAIGVHHPRSPIEEPLDVKRKVLGWLSLIIFIISFSPAPIVIS